MRLINWVIAIASTLSQLLPVLAVRPYWHRASPARKWIVVWSTVFFVSDILQLIVSLGLRVSNLWLFVIVDPIEDAVILWALSYWQLRPVGRIALRLAIVPTVLIYLIIVFATGEVDTYKTFATAFRSLVVFAVALFTLVSRSAAEPEAVWDKDWLWVTLGVAIYYGLLVATDAFVAAIIEENMELARSVFTAKIASNVLVFLLVWRGMRCPQQTASSGSI